MRTQAGPLVARGRTALVGISLIGFGNHALAQHLPNLRSMRGVEIRGIASATGRNVRP